MNKSKIQSKFPSYFNINGTKLTDKKNIATEFNKFFINIGPKLASEIGNEMEHDVSSYMNKKNKERLQIATYNVRTLLKDEHVHILEVVLEETTWNGSR